MPPQSARSASPHPPGLFTAAICSFARSADHAVPDLIGSLPTAAWPDRLVPRLGRPHQVAIADCNPGEQVLAASVGYVATARAITTADSVWLNLADPGESPNSASVGLDFAGGRTRVVAQIGYRLVGTAGSAPLWCVVDTDVTAIVGRLVGQKLDFWMTNGHAESIRKTLGVGSRPFDDPAALSPLDQTEYGDAVDDTSQMWTEPIERFAAAVAVQLHAHAIVLVLRPYRPRPDAQTLPFRVTHASRTARASRGKRADLRRNVSGSSASQLARLTTLLLHAADFGTDVKWGTDGTPARLTGRRLHPATNAAGCWVCFVTPDIAAG